MSIVCIPDAAMLISRSPSRGSWQWLQEISVSTPNAQVLEFTYGLDGEGESIWRWFDIAGDILRNCIIDDGKSFNVSPSPPNFCSAHPEQSSFLDPEFCLCVTRLVASS